MIRLFLKWFASVLLLWGAQIVGLIVVPVALLHLRVRDRHFPLPMNNVLPQWARAWDNADSPFGDTYWFQRYPGFEALRFWPRFRWLALRNRAHNLSRWLGLDGDYAYLTAKTTTSFEQADDSRAWTGKLLVTVWDRVPFDGVRRLRGWESYGVMPYPPRVSRAIDRLLSAIAPRKLWEPLKEGERLGIRWRFGWKIKGGQSEDRPHRLVCNVMVARRIGNDRD
jgi:hypothetical protein